MKGPTPETNQGTTTTSMVTSSRHGEGTAAEWEKRRIGQGKRREGSAKKRRSSGVRRNNTWIPRPRAALEPRTLNLTLPRVYPETLPGTVR